MRSFKSENEGLSTDDMQPDRGVIALLPLEEQVVFPRTVMSLVVDRSDSVRALREAYRGDRRIVVACERDPAIETPGHCEVHEVGTLATIVQLIELPDGMQKVIVEGEERVRIHALHEAGDCLRASFSKITEEDGDSIETRALIRATRSTFEAYAKLKGQVPPEALSTISAASMAGHLADLIAAHLSLSVEQRQLLLEQESTIGRLETVLGLMQEEIEVLQVEENVRLRVKKRIERSQREHYLQEQMRAIRAELGQRDELQDEVQELEEEAEALEAPDAVKERCRKEIRKLKTMSPMSAEAAVVRNYIDWVLTLPWLEDREENTDVEAAQEMFDEDHFGLEKPKDRILEFLSVRSLVERIQGPILCLVGPPGVGKTSLVRSIARATGRDFARISLGGVRDEAEIRGHRRTYVGAMPGRIIQALKKAGSGNPVLLLDEVDKMSMDFRGDPGSALLEVLDPEQNHTFNDHYLDLDFDLSRVMFVATANVLSRIPGPLRDRMEVIEIPGYIEREKLQIAKRFLVPRQLVANGLSDEYLSFGDQALGEMIRSYTRESGVRGLEREIGSVCRRVAREVVLGDRTKRARIGATEVRRYLGVARFRFGRVEQVEQIGVCTGLAYTELGGDLLTIEALVTSGTGRVQLSGLLGETMQESARAALSYVRRRARQLCLDRDFYQKCDIHVHVPEGGVPKDGPSAGIAIATALASALAGHPIRGDVAMTGEVTLRGRVLAVGGLKEKLIAALRGGVRLVLVPKENERELKEIPASITRGLELVMVEHMDEVLRHALKLGGATDLAAAPEYPLEEIFGPSESPAPALPGAG